jgi:hypothetical protein
VYNTELLPIPFIFLPHLLDHQKRLGGMNPGMARILLTPTYHSLRCRLDIGNNFRVKSASVSKMDESELPISIFEGMLRYS